MYALKKSPSSTTDSDSQQTNAAASVDLSTMYAEPSTSWARDNAQTSTSWATHHNVAPPVSWTCDDNARPSTSYAHSEPSTSWANFSTAASSTSAAVDKPKAPDNNDPKSSSSDDDDYLSSDESDSDENLRDIMRSYMYKRNLKESKIIDANNSSQALIEYVNLKYIENNFRTLGLITAFDKNNIDGAQLEFESFEKWFKKSKKKYVGPQRIKDLCAPMFCHLYLCLYTPQNHERLFQLLNKFKYLFLRKNGFVFLQELKKVTTMNNLPYRISIFRKNKYICFVSPEFLSELINFFQQHRMLKLIFQEWFDINYITEEDQKTIVEEYLNRDLPQSYYINTNQAKQSKSNNLNTTSKDDLSTNKSTSFQIKKDSQHGTYSEKTCEVDGHQSTRKRILHYQQKPQSSINQSTDNKYTAGPSDQNGKKKHCGNSKPNKSTGTSTEETMDSSPIPGCSKTMDHNKKHPIDDQSSPPLNGRKSKNLHKKHRGDNTDNSSLPNESAHQQNITEPTKVSNKKKHESKNANYSSLETSSDYEQATQNSRKQRKHQAKYKLSGRSKSMGDNRSSSDSSSESSEDSSSGTSFFDEESAMRKYFRYQRKSGKRLSYKTLHFLKYGNTSKIELKDFDGDLYLHNTRQIILQNISKLTCTLITIDHKYVAAGSSDSIVYLWERTNVPTQKEIRNLLSNMNCNLRKSVHVDESEKNTEFLNRSTAVILRGHGGCIFDLAELPSAKILLSASSDKTFRAWHLEKKVCLEVYDEYEHKSWCITACPYSLQVATGSCQGSSCLWFLNYKRPLRIFMGHLDDILVIKFHPNMVMLATGSADKTIRIFELVTGNCQRLLLGHTDYVTCLAFHPKKAKVLASAAGGGEIMVWNLNTGDATWKLRVGNVAFSELSWLANDILLASLLTGVILKCDVTVDYVKTRKKVRGFRTKFKRLISLSIIDTLVYTIGIQGKLSILKPNVTKLQRKVSAEYEQQQERATLNRNREPSPLSKLFFPEHIIENNGNLIRPLLGLSTTTVNHPKVDFQYHLNMGLNDTTQEASEFLKMNLQNSPFSLTVDDINKIKSKSQSRHISLIERHYSRPSTKQILQNALLLPTQSSDLSLTELPSADLNYFEEYEQKYNFNYVNMPQHSEANLHNNNYSLQSHLMNITKCQFNEHESSESLIDIHKAALKNLRDQRIETADKEAQEQLLLRIANNIHNASTKAQGKIHLMHDDDDQHLHGQFEENQQKGLEQQQYQHQQLHHLQQQQLQHQYQQQHQLQQQQQLQHQHQQQLEKQIKEQQQAQVFRKSLLTKVNVRPTQKHIQLTNISGPKPFVGSVDGHSIRLATRQQRPTTTAGRSSEMMVTSQNYERMRQVVMESLSQTNPEMFIGGNQPIIGEVTISQSTVPLPTDPPIKSEPESD